MWFPKSRLWLFWSSDRKPPHWNTNCLRTNSGSISSDHVWGCVSNKTLGGPQKSLSTLWVPALCLEPPLGLWTIPASILLFIFHGRCLGAFFRTGSSFTPPFISCNWPSLWTWHLLSQSSNTVHPQPHPMYKKTLHDRGGGKYELFQTCNLPDYPVHPKSKQ